MKPTTLPPVLSIVGVHNSGKTTLLELLIPELKKRGITIAVIKHTIHDFQMDWEEKDSQRLYKTGCEAVVISSSDTLALTRRVSGEIPFDDIVSNYLSSVDLVITEGYKKSNKPRIEVLSSTSDENFLSSGSNTLIAVVGDRDPQVGIPFFSRDAIEELASFICEKLL